MSESAFYALEGPLDTIPGERQMRTANFSGFAPLVRALGGDPRVVLEHHGLSPRVALDPERYVDCQSFVDVLEYSSRTFNDPLFGMRLAQGQDPAVFGCVTALCRAAPTFKDALHAFVEYLPVTHSPLTIMELLEGEHTTELSWGVRTDLGANIQAHYQGAVLDLALLRQIGGRAFRADYVMLASDARAKDISAIESKLGCHFRHRSYRNAVAFPTEFLNRPVPSANRLMYRLLGGYLARVKTASSRTLEERVPDYVRGALAAGVCSIEHCAQKLGSSVRTLQSQLSERGLRFSDIVEQQRLELAKNHLAENRLTLEEVAISLGYSEQSSFGRAFKRWTGVTPHQYRAAHVASRDALH